MITEELYKIEVAATLGTPPSMATTIELVNTVRRLQARVAFLEMTPKPAQPKPELTLDPDYRAFAEKLSRSKDEADQAMGALMLMPLDAAVVRFIGVLWQALQRSRAALADSGSRTSRLADG